MFIPRSSMPKAHVLLPLCHQMMVRAFESPGESFLHILSIWCLPKTNSPV